MGISMEDVKELRERTGAGVLDCKKALSEKDGDIEAAVEYLRQKGMAEADKKSGRVAAEGRVNVVINNDRSEGVIAEINSETDFVAKNDNFIELVNKISDHLMQSEADTVEEVMAEGWYENENKDVDTVIKEAIASIGENINLRRFQRFETDGFVEGYIHMDGKIGVLVDLEGELSDENLKTAKNIAMHIAASAPQFINREDVDQEVIDKEKEIYREQMLNEGKPEHIIDNIVEGKMGKYFTQICLVEQEYVRDTDMTVGELLKESNLMVNNFIRYELGEGIETEEEDFASEVMAEIDNN